MNGAAVLYSCRMRTNYEPGEFQMLHPQEFIAVRRNPSRIYLMLRNFTRSRGAIDNVWKSYIEYGGETRKTLYQAQMTPSVWLELIDHVSDPDLAPLRAFYEGMIDDGEAVRQRLDPDSTGD